MHGEVEQHLQRSFIAIVAVSDTTERRPPVLTSLSSDVGKVAAGLYQESVILGITVVSEA